MFEFHGEDWETQLKTSADDQADDPEKKGVGGLQLVDPRAPRAPDLSAAPVPTAPHLLSSPGSGSNKSGSPRSSQMSPRQIKRKAGLPYDPSKQSLTEYYTKIEKYQS